MNKQTEEMAKSIDTIMRERCFHNSCVSCEFEYAYDCKANMLATTLANDYGYRKASDVAHEIFSWIEEHMYNANFVRGTVEIDFCSYLAFKKKYESEGAE